MAHRRNVVVSQRVRTRLVGQLERSKKTGSSRALQKSPGNRRQAFPPSRQELAIHFSFTSLYTSVMNRFLLAGVSPFVVASYGAVRFAARISSSDLP